ncbi:hypothetical protein ACWHA6_36265 [Streptomyces anthocyanicus]
MTWHIHDWSAWRTFDVKQYVDPDFGDRWTEYMQDRTCRRCGKAQIRKRKP